MHTKSTTGINSVKLDLASRVKLVTLGNGNLSRGIRLAAELLPSVQDIIDQKVSDALDKSACSLTVLELADMFHISETDASASMMRYQERLLEAEGYDTLDELIGCQDE